MKSSAEQGRSGLTGSVSSSLLLLLIVGDILGAGIYVLVGEVAAEVGGLLWLAFGGAFVVALASATSYAELVTRLPGAAGSPLYARHAFNSPTLTALVGFAVFAATISTAATTARAFAGDYLDEFVALPTAPVAVLVVGLLTLVASFGIETSSRTSATLTVVETAGLILVITAGVVAVFGGFGEVAMLTDTRGSGGGSLLAGTALAFFAFLGFEDAVHLSEEVDNPGRTFPRALLGSVAITGVVYMLVVLTAGLLVEPTVLATSEGPLLEVVRASPLNLPNRLFAGIALGAVTNTCLFAIVAASRLLYGLADAGELPPMLVRVSGRGSPVVAVGTVGATVAVLAATGAVGALATTAVNALLFVLLIVNISAIRTRHLPGGWRPPGWVAYAGAAASGGLFVNQLLTAASGDLVRLGVLLAIGAALRFVARP